MREMKTEVALAATPRLSQPDADPAELRASAREQLPNEPCGSWDWTGFASRRDARRGPRMRRELGDDVGIADRSPSRWHDLTWNDHVS